MNEHVGIDPQDVTRAESGVPYNAESFKQMRVVDTWHKYKDVLSWGKGQCLAILDDGCDVSVPAWQVQLPWGPKVVATYNSIDDNDDPTPVPPGYHGTTVGYPSSMNHDGMYGVAYQNAVAQVRCVRIVHLHQQDEAPTMAKALQWVLDHATAYNITAVNLSPLDDERHREPVPTAIDEKLFLLRQKGIWVSAPCGNHHYIDGISWPACQPNCFGIGATLPNKHEVHLDRYHNTDLLVAAQATSSSNAYAVACAQILREAIEICHYPWQNDASNLPEAMLGIFKNTGVAVTDVETNGVFYALDLLASVNFVFESTS